MALASRRHSPVVAGVGDGLLIHLALLLDQVLRDGGIPVRICVLFPDGHDFLLLYVALCGPGTKTRSWLGVLPIKAPSLGDETVSPILFSWFVKPARSIPTFSSLIVR